eukprot:749952-Hanusia_phi.AAC.3
MERNRRRGIRKEGIGRRKGSSGVWSAWREEGGRMVKGEHEEEEEEGREGRRRRRRRRRKKKKKKIEEEKEEEMEGIRTRGEKV